MIGILESLVRRPAVAHASHGRFPGSSALLCSTALLGLAPTVRAQARFEERALERYFPAVADATADLVAADFDGDGDPDVLTANEYELERLYRNDGEGIFVDVTDTNLPLLPFFLGRIGIGDIDGDGDLDALLTSGGSVSAAPLLLVNDGTGRFDDETVARLPASALQALPGATRPLFGDVDGDGDLDLVTPELGLAVCLYLNDGLGFFTDVSASQMPGSLNANKEAALADVDGDLDLDLVLANDGQDRLYLNDGLGSFTDVTATNLPVEPAASSPESMALVDVDLDLDLDIVIGNGGASGANTLLLNDGMGVFGDASSNLPPTADTVSSIAVGDVDGDLDPDIVFGNEDRSELLLGDGTGAFAEAPFPSAGIDSDRVGGLALADVDGDSDLDLLMGRSGIERLYLGDGNGRFTNASEERVPWGLDHGAALELVDLDRDGDQDLVAATGSFQGLGYGEVRTFFNDGTGAFPTGAVIPLENAIALAAGDVDGDADVDLLVGSASLCPPGSGCQPKSDRLLFNDGQGGFGQVPGRLPSDEDDTFAVALADVDGDADLDAVLGTWQGQSRLYRNTGDGTFSDVTAGRLPARSDATEALGIGDFDRDGDLDIVVGNDGEQSRMYVNEGLGAFFDGTATRMPPLARFTHALGVADMDGDGALDLVLGSGGRTGLYLNNGAGKLLDYSDSMPQQTEEAWSVAIGDVDEDGDLDVLLGNRVSAYFAAPNRLLLNDGTTRFTVSGRLPGDLDRTAALALGDVDGDRDLDLVAGNLDPISLRFLDTNRLYLNLHRQLDARTLPLLGRSTRSSSTPSRATGACRTPGSSSSATPSCRSRSRSLRSSANWPSPRTSSTPPRRRSRARPARSCSSSPCRSIPR